MANLTIHEMYHEAMWPHLNRTLSTSEIGEIVLHKFPDFNLGSNLPNDHSDIGNKGQCWCAKSNQRIFNKISHGRYQVFYKRTMTEDIQEIQASDALVTTKKTLIDARLGQGKFRENLINHWGCCAVTGISLTTILKASHIKPWALCENSNERLDKFNGLLLCPNIDSLFDQGYISFDNDGKIIISALIEDRLTELDISPNMKITTSSSHYKYLEFHRNNIFRKNIS